MRPMINDFYLKIAFRFTLKKEFVGCYKEDEKEAPEAASLKRSRYFECQTK